jgi:hypothetical protein
MAYQKGLELEDGTSYSYHRIIRIQLPAFVLGEGLSNSTGHVLVESYSSKQAFDAGKKPIPATVRAYYLRAEAFKTMPSLSFNSNDSFMIWAYNNFREYLPDLSDSVIVDIVPVPGSDNSI